MIDDWYSRVTRQSYHIGCVIQTNATRCFIFPPLERLADEHIRLMDSRPKIVQDADTDDYYTLRVERKRKL